MNINNELYKSFKCMMEGYKKGGEEGHNMFVAGVIGWMSFKADNPFNPEDPVYDYYDRIKLQYLSWKQEGVGRSYSKRKMLEEAKNLCALKPKNPYHFDKKADAEEKARLAEEEEQKAKIQEELRLKRIEEEAQKKVMLEERNRKIQEEKEAARKEKERLDAERRERELADHQAMEKAMEEKRAELKAKGIVQTEDKLVMLDVPAEEIEEEPKKKHFFGRLFRRQPPSKEGE